jgi:hypothetical protein
MVEAVMKNLADHDVSVFLFKFVLQEGGINFVVNEGVAEDFYPQTGFKLQPLLQACGETLMRYKGFCNEKVIMDGNILMDGNFEVMLSPGLGKYFAEREKQSLFSDAHKIAKILIDVMERRTQEIKLGTYLGPQAPPHKGFGMTGEGLESLGKERLHAGKLGDQRLDLKQLTAADLPAGVVATLSYDHRGYCLGFTHKDFGYLGKIVISGIGDRTLMETELSIENQQHLDEKKEVLKNIVAVLEAGIRNRNSLN